MTEGLRYISAAAFFAAAALVMATLLVQLPAGTTATSFLVAAIGWYVLYPVARLTWLRGIAEWRYWLIGGLMAVGVPVLEGVRRAETGEAPSPVLQWLTGAIIVAVLGVALVRKRIRRR